MGARPLLRLFSQGLLCNLHAGKITREEEGWILPVLPLTFVAAMLPVKLHNSSTMNTSIQPTAKQYSYNEVVALFNNDYVVDGIIKVLECPKDIKLPKAVFDEVEYELDKLEVQQFELVQFAQYQTDKGTLFEVDVENGEVYFAASDRVNNTELEFSNIVALLQPFGMKFQDVLEEEWDWANALPLEEKIKFFNHC